MSVFWFVTGPRWNDQFCSTVFQNFMQYQVLKVLVEHQLSGHIALN